MFHIHRRHQKSAEWLSPAAPRVDNPAWGDGIERERQSARHRWREVAVDIDDDVGIVRRPNRNLTVRARTYQRCISHSCSGVVIQSGNSGHRTTRWIRFQDIQRAAGWYRSDV